MKDDLILIFETHAGARCFRYGLGITVEGPRELWWSYRLRRWIDVDDRKRVGGDFTTMVDCRTLRAFKSHLRRHENDLSGMKVTWHSRFVGHDVYTRL